MPVVKYCDLSYSCSVAIKGNTFIELRDEADNAFCRFDGINDFSLFTITDGTWTGPTGATEILAKSAVLSGGNLVLMTDAEAGTGTLVKFEAPCACHAITGGLTVSGVTYLMVDAMDMPVTGASAWCKGAMVSFILNRDTKKAYLLNSSPTTLAVLNIRTLPGANVDATLGSTTVSGVATLTGACVLSVGAVGEWTITVHFDGDVQKTVLCVVSSLSETYDIDGVATLEETSWNAIDKVSATGNARLVWSIGDEKKAILNGYECTFVIADFSRDDLADGSGKAGITFVETSGQTGSYQMHETNHTTTADGSYTSWVNSIVRVSVLPALFEQLDDDMRSAIKPVTKVTYCSNYSHGDFEDVTTERLFLLNNLEGGFNGNAAGKAYEFFGAGNTVKYNAPHWCRNSYNYNDARRQYYTMLANKSSGYLTWATYDAEASYPITLAFCV